jgi:hypothetical protein
MARLFASHTNKTWIVPGKGRLAYRLLVPEDEITIRGRVAES